MNQILNGFAPSVTLMTSASSGLWAKFQANWIGRVLLYIKSCTAPTQYCRPLIKGLYSFSHQPAVPGRVSLLSMLQQLEKLICNIFKFNQLLFAIAIATWEFDQKKGHRCKVRETCFVSIMKKHSVITVLYPLPLGTVLGTLRQRHKADLKPAIVESTADKLVL